MDDNRIKQRIIGAIVLVSLGVIFIPMILSGGREQTMPLFGSPIPPKPDNIANIKVLELKIHPNRQKHLPKFVPRSTSIAKKMTCLLLRRQSRNKPQ